MVRSRTSRKKGEMAARRSIDRISNLPDSLLHHILSYLPTKQAVATSFLSKRWRPLWLSLHTLDFDDLDFCKDGTYDPCFVNFVDAVLILRDFQPIKRFRLYCRSSVPLSNFNVWVNAAINHDVEELELDLLDHILPSCIFVCSTIRVLKLENVIVCTISSVHLPSLKVLHLVDTVFENKESAVKLFSGCKFLEELVIRDSCGIDSIDNVIVLTQLVRAQVDLHIIFQSCIAIHDVQFLSINPISSWPNEKNPIPIFPNLTHLEFGSLHCSWEFLMLWLQKCPKLQTLVICLLGDTVNWISYGDMEKRLIMEPEFVPQCLSEHMEKFYLGDYEGTDNEQKLARVILEHARVLKTVTISSFSYSTETEKLQMIKRLASYARGSETCRLLFS